MKQTGEYVVGALSLDTSSSTPLYKQIHDGIRQAVLDGRLEPGQRLPATRDFAAKLGVSRNTVKTAFEQLVAEGFLEAGVGSGTRVTEHAPFAERMLRKAQKNVLEKGTSAQTVASQHASQRGVRFAGLHVTSGGEIGGNVAFRSGMPALDAFPFELWGQLAARYYRKMPSSWSEASPVDPLGYGPLRRAIATYFKATRGVRCTAEQVIVTSGTQQALYLVAQTLLNGGEQVWLEDPGYLGARHAFAVSGARIVPVPVDALGMNVDVAIRSAPKARMVYTTPSHQFPLGVALSLERRFALLQWASANQAWVIEDDYDSEFRYHGYPIPSLQGLDTAERVVYLGSFNKVLFPGLRLGYLIVPPGLVEVFAGAMEVISGAATITNQVVLTTFIEQGHFQRHIRRMRLLYAERLEAFARLAEDILGARFPLGPHNAGMHFTLGLPPGMEDQATAQRLQHDGLEAAPLSRFALQPLPLGGLLLGCCAVPVDQMEKWIRRLAAALDA